MAKRKQQPPDEGSPAWMSTFSDLMNLLLCFFILLFASSTMDEGKIQKIAASFDNLSFSVISEGSVSLLTGEMLSGGMTQLADTDSVLSEARQEHRRKHRGQVKQCIPDGCGASVR